MLVQPREPQRTSGSHRTGCIHGTGVSSRPLSSGDHHSMWSTVVVRFIKFMYSNHMHVVIILIALCWLIMPIIVLRLFVLLSRYDCYGIDTIISMHHYVNGGTVRMELHWFESLSTINQALSTFIDPYHWVHFGKTIHEPLINHQ